MGALKTLNVRGLSGTAPITVSANTLRSGRDRDRPATAGRGACGTAWLLRTPVREALTRLASEGLLASDGRSFVVPALTERDIEEIYELRLMLEPEALRRVAEAMTDPSKLRDCAVAWRRCAPPTRRMTPRPS